MRNKGTPFALQAASQEVRVARMTTENSGSVSSCRRKIVPPPPPPNYYFRAKCIDTQINCIFLRLFRCLIIHAQLVHPGKSPH